MGERPSGHASSCLNQRVCWLVAALCLVWPHAALHAQSPGSGLASDPTRDASARALFEEGVHWAEQRNWTEAEDRFRRALTLRASPVIAYNLASVLASRGKLVEATELLRHVETDDKADLDLKQSAHALKAELNARIARIAIELRGGQPGDEILLDGAALHDAQLDVEIPIDPGSHQLQVKRGGESLASRALQVRPGSVEHVTLVVPVRVPSPAAVASASASNDSAPLAAVPQRDEPRPSGPISSRWWFWTGAGVVVVAAAVVSIAAASGGGTQPAQAYRGDFAPGSLAVQVKP